MLGARCARLGPAVFELVAGGVCCLNGVIATWRAVVGWMLRPSKKSRGVFAGGVSSSIRASAWSAFGQLGGNLAKSLTDLQVDVDE